MQGALCWIMANGANVIALPGARTVAQVTENARALEFGALDTTTMAEIEAVLTRPPEGPARAR